MALDYPPPLPLLDIDHAPDEIRAAMQRGQASAGSVINMYRGMAHAPGLLDTYLEGSARFRAESGFTPTEQEVVFISISRVNDCRYCVAGHSTLAERRGIDRQVIQALRDGHPLADPRLEVLRNVTIAALVDQGRIDPELLEQFVEAGYRAEQILFIILAIGMKMLSNSTNHYLHTPLDDAFAQHTWHGPGRNARNH